MARRRKQKSKASKPSAASDSAAAGAGELSPPTRQKKQSSPVKTLTPEAIRPKLPWLSRIVSLAMLIVGTLVVGLLFYRVMAVFFVPLFIAAALVVIFRPVHAWFLVRLKQRARLAALATTGLILTIVLMPVLLVISVAATQFTFMVSHVNYDDLTDAVDRARDQLGLTLPEAEKFRRLDRLADRLDGATESADSGAAEPAIDLKVISREIKAAKALVLYLQENVPGPVTAEPYAARAVTRLEQYEEVVTAAMEPAAGRDELTVQFDEEESFHRPAVFASAAIRAWINQLLGGSFRSQARLLANPSEADFASLLRSARAALQPRFVKLTQASGLFMLQTTIALVILVIAVYFFLVDGPSMVRTLMRLSPLDDNYERRLLDEFDRTSRAVVLASILSALVQGLLAAIAFYFCGLKSVVLLFLVTSLMALIPFLGAASVWIPCALYLGAVEQRWTAALILAIYGALVVSSIDNVIKAYVLHGHSQLHPLFALLSVLGGVQVFGPVGILVGPMVVVFLQTLLEILNHELGTHSSDDDVEPKQALPAAAVSST